MFFICCTTVQKTALALFLFRTGLTRQWHARGESERADSIPSYPIDSRRGRSDDPPKPIGDRAASGNTCIRVTGTREGAQLLYAGRQRAEAFLSPEKTTVSRFLWITRELEKTCGTT